MLSVSIARYVRGYLVQASSGLNLLARRMGDHPDPFRVLQEFQLNNPVFDRVILFSRTTNLIASSPSVPVRPDYGPLLESADFGPDGTRLTAVYFASRDGQLTVGLVKQLSDKRLLLGELKLSSLQRFVYRIQLEESRRQVFVTDRFGNLIAHPNYRYVQRRENYGHLEVFKQRSSSYTVESYAGTLWMFRLVPIGQSHWQVVVGFPFSRLWLPVIRIFIAIFLVVGLTAATVVAWVRHRVALTVSAPLAQLAGQAVALQQNREDEVPVLSPGIGELRQLADRFYAMSRTVREREQRLTESRLRLQMALAGADLGGWDWNIQTGETVFDKRWAGMLGYPLDELEFNVTTFQRLVHPEDRPQVDAALDEHFRGLSTQYEVEIRMLTVDGQWRWILARGRVMEWDQHGAPLRMSGTHLDIMARKQAEQQLIAARDEAERASRAKSGFMAMITHEIRTPLNAIIGYSSLLLEEPHQLLEERLRSINLSGRALLSLVNSILDFSRYELSRPEPLWRPVDLRQIIAEIEAFFQLQAEQQGLQFQTECKASVPETFISDSNRLRQILINLVTNAFKFTREGSVTVTAQLLPGKERDAGSVPPVLEIVIKDSGEGISESEQELIFEPFKQADSGFQRRYAGVGLGLAITRQSVELLGGEISVSSVKGEGSTFTVRLPEVGKGSTPSESEQQGGDFSVSELESEKSKEAQFVFRDSAARRIANGCEPPVAAGAVELEELLAYIERLRSTPEYRLHRDLKDYADRLEQAAQAFNLSEIRELLRIPDRAAPDSSSAE